MNSYSEVEFHVRQSKEETRTETPKYTPVVSPPGKWIETGTKQEATTKYLNQEFTVRTNQETAIRVTVKGIVIYGGIILCLCQVEEKYQRLYGKEPLTFYSRRLVSINSR